MQIVKRNMGCHVHWAVRRAMWLTALMGVVSVVPVHAADTAGQTVGQLEEIVVTARKRSETQLTTPTPMSTITNDALRQQGAAQFSDYLTTTPGANFTSSRVGSTMIILRGITTGDNVNPTVATYVDDAPFGSSTIFALGSALTPDIDPVDIDHIELLRGPQGTLYGANAIGGILKFVTVPPKTTGFSGRVEVGTDQIEGGGSGWDAHAAVNVPLSDNFAVRASGYYRGIPGFIDDPFRHKNDINNASVKGGLVSALWLPASNLTVHLSALLHDSNSNNSNTEDVNPFTMQPLYGDLTEHRYLPQPLDVRYRLYNASVSYDFDEVTAMLSSSYSTERVGVADDQTPSYLPLLGALFGPTFSATLARQITQSKWTEEARLSSRHGHFIDWQLGAFFTREMSDAFDTVPTYDSATGQPTPIPNLFTADLNSRYKELSGYGDLDFHFTEAFDTMVGFRYSHDQQPYHQTASGLLYGAPVDINANTTESATTFLFNPRYKIDNYNMVYARIASGYRPGGPNALPPAALGFPTSFGPDNLVNYELGWKASLLDHHLTVDVSGFHIDWNKIQLAENKGGYTAEGNGGKARSDGFEAQVTWMPLKGLTVSANAAYTDAVMETNSPDVGALKGDRLPLVPRLNWGLNGDYDWSVGNGWEAFVGTTYRNIGDRPNLFTVITVGTNAVPYGAPGLPGYYQLDLRTGVSFDNWTLRLYAKNVTNQRGILSLGPTGLDPTAPDYTAAIIDPRTIGLNLSMSF